MFMTQTKKERRLRYLMSLYPIMVLGLRGDTRKSFEMHITNIKQYTTKREPRAKELMTLIESMGYDADKLMLEWLTVSSATYRRRMKSRAYSKMPKNIRQDNKTYVNTSTSPSSSYPKIRYPKKVRKTAWKRFYKLFPHLKPEL